jgi:hypothetical protein
MCAGGYRWLVIAYGLLGLSCDSQAPQKVPVGGAGGITTDAGSGGAVQSTGGDTTIALGGQGGKPGQGGAGGAGTGADGSAMPDVGRDGNSPDGTHIASGGIGGNSGFSGAGGMGGAGENGGSDGDPGGAARSGGGGSPDSSPGSGGWTGGGGSSGVGGSTGKGGTGVGDASTAGTGAEGQGGAGGTGGGGGTVAAGGGGATHSDGGGGASSCMGTSIIANEANDYSFSSTLTFPPVKVAPKSNLQFDWSGVTADFGRHTVDPKKGLNTVLIFEWNLTVDDFQTKVNTDGLAVSDLTFAPSLSFTTDGETTSAHLLDFTLNGSPIGGDLVSVDQVMSFFDPGAYDPATHTYTMMAASGAILGQGTRMIQAFLVDPNSTNTSVTMTNDSSRLDFRADLTRLRPTTIPAGQPSITLDWSNMKINALGGDFSGENAIRITSTFIGHYDESPSELSGDKFLDIELIATALFRTTVAIGTSVDLSTLQDSEGNSFSGIDNSGTWLLGLQCGDCRNPAPWYMTVLRPCN